MKVECTPHLKELEKEFFQWKKNIGEPIPEGHPDFVLPSDALKHAAMILMSQFNRGYASHEVFPFLGNEVMNGQPNEFYLGVPGIGFVLQAWRQSLAMESELKALRELVDQLGKKAFPVEKEGDGGPYICKFQEHHGSAR